MRIIASIEARMASSRLPGKVLADVAGQPALTRLARRLKCCSRLDGIILATSTSPDDDCLEEWAARENLPCHRGSENDVLARVVGAHRRMQSDLIVEITGDCTLLDPAVVDLGVNTFFEMDCDVVSSTRTPSYPMGIDVQVFRFKDLEDVEKTVTDPAVREHVSLYFYEHPERYRIVHLLAPDSLRAQDFRFQLDYPEDLRFITEVYKRLESIHGEAFGTAEILELLRQEPALTEINRDCEERAARQK